MNCMSCEIVAVSPAVFILAGTQRSCWKNTLIHCCVVEKAWIDFSVDNFSI